VRIRLAGDFGDVEDGVAAEEHVSVGFHGLAVQSLGGVSEDEVEVLVEELEAALEDGRRAQLDLDNSTHETAKKDRRLLTLHITHTDLVLFPTTEKPQPRSWLAAPSSTQASAIMLLNS